MLKRGGSLGFICPHKFFNSDFGSGLRQFLLTQSALESFISFSNNPIFSDVSTYTGILLLKKTLNKFFSYFEFKNLPNLEIYKHLRTITKDDFTTYSIAEFTSKPWVLTYSLSKTLLEKLHEYVTLGEIFSSIFQGVVTGIDEIYFLKRAKNTQEEILEVYSQRENKNIQIERAILKPMLKGEDISRYDEPNFKYYCIYPYKFIGGKTVILQEDEFSLTFPLAYQYLSQYRQELRGLRTKFKTNPQYWYSCHRGRSIDDFDHDRIVTPEISLGCNMTYSPPGIYHNTKVYSLIPPSSRLEHQRYWLGILNSKMLWWFLANTGYVLRGGYFVFKTHYLRPFPIRLINFSNYTDKVMHDRVVELVEYILELHKQLATARTDHEQTAVQRQIDTIDRQIDQLVYQLYGLTAEEVNIVEQTSQ